MRYEDASQAGSTAAGSDPIARADVETLPQGSNGPGSGNAISGLGTTTGPAGADQVADGPATIVELRGASGAAAPSGNGFEAPGQYGTLSMDLNGNFNYVRTTPADGVQDVFEYTLADAKGARSSTTLTVEIPRVIDEQAVVNLPAGVQMSDIKVVGRDLVIQMPDGTQMVIPGGAVFVPELSIGDVIVPPTNLAALLIDSEPQPAAGPPQSSGGNFADDVPPLDPGVPLGDLIPPTETDYTPPEYEEPMEIEDTEPTIIIITPDNPAGAVAATASVDESGLPERPGEPEGTLEPQNIETTSGTIVFTADDGLETIAINGTVITAVGQQIQGEHGVLTITSINLATGEIGYTYTATDNTTDGLDDFENFTVVVTDEDGDTATATLHIDILDDEPIARDDVDVVNLQTNSATGNVMTGVGTNAGTASGDTVGADDATLTAVEGDGGSDSSFDSNGNLVVNGEFGTLTIDAEGNYTYVPFADAPGGTEDVFTYTLTDGDGDVITATLTIINPDQTPTAGSNPVVQLDDDALVGGNPGGTNDDPNSVNATGTLSGSGGDGQLTFDLLTTGAPAGFTYVDGPNGSILVQQVQDGVTVTVLTITVDPATGEYTVVQNANILHPPGQTENNVVFTINYTVTDSDGDVATSSLTVNVDDDTPLANNDTDTLSQNGQATGNVITGAGTNQGTGNADKPGADGFAGIVGLQGANGTDNNPSGGFVVQGEFGTLTMDENGEYTYVRDPNNLEGGEDVFTYTYVDGDGDTVTATLTIIVPDIDLIPVATPPADVIVDDDDVGSEGNPDGVDDDVPQNATGTLTGTGGNGDLDFFFDVDATENGLPAGFSLDPASTSTSLLIMQGTTLVMTITLNSETGEYTVVQNAPIDHPAGDDENNVDFDIIFFAQDEDGDQSDPETLNISVDDDTPEVNEGATVTGLVDEDDLPDGNDDNADGDDDPGNADGDNDGTTTGGNAGSLTALFSIGADQPGKIVLLSDTSSLEAQNLTSNGHDLLYDVSGGTLTAYADLNDDGLINDGPDSTVFILTVNEDGSWVFDLEGQLDHESAGTEDDILIDFSGVIGAEDADGDPAGALPDGSFVVTVDDDLPAAVEEPNPVTGLVDEDDLPDGNDDNADGDDDPGNADGDNDGTTTGGNAGSLTALFSIGADQPGKIVLLSDTSSLEAQNLTSNGHDLLYDVSGGTLTAYADLNDDGLINDGPDSTVFILTVNEDGSWVFDLEGQLDHESAGTEDDILIDFSGVIGAEDADGDPAGALPDGSFVVTVDDDLPAAVEEPNPVTGLVDEDDLPDGNDDNADGDDDPGNADGDNDGTTTGGNAGSLTALFSIGADQPGKIVLLSDTSSLEAQNLTSNGHDLLYDVSGGTLTAYADLNDDGLINDGPDSTVFILTVNEDGSWVFDLEGQLDHESAGTEDDILIDFSGVIGAEDADGDPAGALPDGSFVVTVDDDLPAAVEEPNPVTGLVDEDDLPDGNDDNADGDDDPGNADGDNDGTTTGGNAGSLTALFSIGADQPGKIVLLSDTSSLEAQNLTSNGHDLLYDVSGGTLTAYADLNDDGLINDGPDSTVFILTVNEDGSWVFDLEGQLDHESAGTEDDILIDFSGVIGAEDADGDPAGALPDGSFVVTVDDDLPTANPPVENEPLITGVVDEDDLPDGVGDDADGDDDPTNPLNGTVLSGTAGSLAVLFNPGADQPLVYGLNPDTSSLEDQNLQSGGEDLAYAVVDGVVYAYTGDGDLDGDGVPTTGLVFTLEVNEDGSWEFELLAQLDHPEAETEDNLLIDFSGMVIAEDSDGDPVTAAAGTFVIDVDDDLPILGAFEDAIVPNEEGSVDGTYEYNWGADDFGELTVTGPEIEGIEYESETLEDGTVILHGMAGDTEVFNLVVRPDGTYTFNLLEPDEATDVTFDLTNLDSGNADFAQTQDGTVEFSPFDNDGNDTGSVNSSNVGFGVGNQFTGNGEAFTLEFHTPGQAGDQAPGTNPDFVDKVAFTVPANGVNGSTVTLTWYAYNTVTNEMETGTIIVTDSNLEQQIVIDPSISFNVLVVEGSDADGQGVRLTELTVSQTILPQDQELDFTISATDGDGDPTGTSTLTVVIDAEQDMGFTSLAMEETSTMSQSADMSATVVPSNDNGAPVREFINGNQAALMGAVAAAGLEMSGRIADVRAIVDDIRGEDMQASGSGQSAAVSGEADQASAAIVVAAAADANAKAASVEAQAQSGGAPAKESAAGLESANDDQAADLSALALGTDAHSAASDHASAMTAAAVAMPGVELVAALEAAASQSATVPANASVAHNAEVGRVLADALAGGNGPDLEALVAALGGGEGGAREALQALSGLRSGEGSFEASAFGNVGNVHTALSMDALALHHDATPV